MPETTDNFTLAAKHIAEARAINDEFEGKQMPAEAARQMGAHLDKARRFREQGQLEVEEKWLATPAHSHDMTAPPGGSKGWHDIEGGEHVDDAGVYRFVDGFRGDRWDAKSLPAGARSLVRYARSGVWETKADLVENADGLTLVPVDFAGTILKDLSRDSVIRSLATIHPTTSKTVDVGEVIIASGGWGVLELGDALADGLAADPANKQTITVWDLNALVKIGRDELEDADESVAQLIREAVVAKFAEQEDDAFAFGAGDGSKMPWGITHTVTQGFAAAVNATLVSDDIKKLTFSVPAWARKNGVFLGHSSVEQAASLLKDVNGNYILQPQARSGEPPTVFGYRWYTVDGLPSMTTTGTPTDPSLVFADVKAGFMIADRRRITVDRLSERFIDAGKIGLLFTLRAGGDVIRPKAIARLLL